MKPSAIFFDMDGVLCDFVAGSLAAHGKPDAIHPASVTWDFFTQVGLTAEEFWEPLSRVEFWENLPPLADGVSLLRWAFRAFGDDRVTLLSSGVCPGSCDGKRRWLAKHFPDTDLSKRAIFGTVKELCAAPCKVLIDDHEPNVEKFRAAGGHAVLVPRPWNSRRAETCRELGRFSPERLAQEISDAWPNCFVSPLTL